jgi:ArsR family transcriptional regulator
MRPAACLVTAHPDGRFIRCRADLATMNGLVAYLTDNCCRSRPAAVCCEPVTPKPRIVARSARFPSAKACGC